MIKKIVLATQNSHKVSKLTAMTKDYFDIVEVQDKKIEVDENEDSFLGNAELKARLVSKVYDCYAIATDGGILIPSLGKNWNGLLTRRFLGKKNITDVDRIDGLLELMKDKKDKERDMFWREAVAIANKGKVIFSKEVDGDQSRVQENYDISQYKEGIWLCTLTYYPQFNNKNFFELSDDELKYAEKSWEELRVLVNDFLSK